LYTEYKQEKLISTAKIEKPHLPLVSVKAPDQVINVLGKEILPIILSSAILFSCY